MTVTLENMTAEQIREELAEVEHELFEMGVRYQDLNEALAEIARLEAAESAANLALGDLFGDIAAALEALTIRPEEQS